VNILLALLKFIYAGKIGDVTVTGNVFPFIVGNVYDLGGGPTKIL